MTLNTANCPRSFEMIKSQIKTDGSKETAMLSLPVRQLTLRQIKQVGERVAEHIKNMRRKEFIALSQELPEKERTAFLVASARSNMSIDQEEMENCADTLWGMLNVLRTATDLSEQELSSLVDEQANIEQLDMARYYALGLDIDALMAELNRNKEEELTEAENKENSEAVKTEATFPVSR